MNRRHMVTFDRRERFKPTDILIGLVFTLFLISLGVILAINLRPLYYMCIKWFDIDRFSGMTVAEIKLNYNALIDYCWPFHTAPLSFPTLAASATGLSHFAECKVIFNALYIICVSGLVIGAGIVVYKYKKKDFSYLKVSAITVVVLPVIVGVMCAINFDYTFELMHKIVFNNSDWLFDPATDPVINILPEEFFLVCAIVIIVTVIVGSVVMAVRYAKRKKNRNSEWLMPRKKNYYY